MYNCVFFLLCIILKPVLSIIPYIENLLLVATFIGFPFLVLVGEFSKFSLRLFRGVVDNRQHELEVHESFLQNKKISFSHQSTKVYHLERFPLYDVHS